MRVTLFAVIIISLASVFAAADTTPPSASVWMNNAGHVWVSPAGRGPALTDAYGAGWLPRVDATVHVRLLDGNGDPIDHYPAEDIWLGAAAGVPFVYCFSGTIADADTDLTGHTTISHPLWAGGQIPPTSQPLVFVASGPIGYGNLPLTVNSPDVNGDLAVDLSDLVYFTQRLLGGVYDFRFDFNLDGVINLSDVSVFAWSLGDHCN